MFAIGLLPLLGLIAEQELPKEVSTSLLERTGKPTGLITLQCVCRRRLRRNLVFSLTENCFEVRCGKRPEAVS